MVPIPDYLKAVSKLEKNYGNRTVFSLQCTCGGQTFYIFENKLTAEEKKLVQPYYDTLEYLYCNGGYGVTGHWVDEYRSEHVWKLLSPEGINGPKEDVTIPSMPIFAGVSKITCRCASCQREFLLFDSRKHGYDGLTTEKSAEELQYQPAQKQKNKAPVAIQISVENDESLLQFQENTGLDFDEKQYSNAFSWISIYVIINGKKRKLFDIETA